MNEEVILLSHGNGGEETKKLIEEMIIKHLGNEILNSLWDSAILKIEGGSEKRIGFTTDSFVVSPIFFRGGNIGELSVYGTCNDLGVMGADPWVLSLGLIIEEGFKLKELEKIIESIKFASIKANVKVVAGDTKVVERGKGDGVYINTAGIGVIENRRDWTQRIIKEGDIVIITGSIGDHGISILLDRVGVKVSDEVKSDLYPINLLAIPLLDQFQGIKFMRDPTRGGVATVLNEVAKSYRIEIEIEEESLPIKPWVKEASELLGVDPLYMANEGKIVIIADPNEAEPILKFIKKHDIGHEAKAIGKVIGEDKKGRVYLKTKIGSYRLLSPLRKEVLPRIC